jgi:O-methyltransferase involved in polyketide biosynthesis
VNPSACEYLEVELNAAIARGATQYVILGRGLGTDSYRNQNTNLRVFEVEHPATQAWSLRSALDAAGFQAGQVSFFSWLGASLYPSAQTTLETLAFIGSLPTGSGLVFDYAVRRSAPSVPGEETAMDALASRIAAQGEPLQLYVDSYALEKLLRAAGFHDVEDLRVPPGLAQHVVAARV